MTRPLSNKLIGSENSTPSYWGYYYKGKQLIEKRQFQNAYELLIPRINKINLDTYPLSIAMGKILELLSEIVCTDKIIFPEEKKKLLKISWILYGIEPLCEL